MSSHEQDGAVSGLTAGFSVREYGLSRSILRYAARRPGLLAAFLMGGFFARTAGMAPITDDNIGEEYSFLLRNDPMLDQLYRLLRL